MSSRTAPPEREEELHQFAGILHESLKFPNPKDVDFLSRYRTSDIRLIHRGGRVAGGLVLLPCGQFFAGQRLPMVGINAVAVAPEARGTGAGRALMAAAVEELAGPGGPPLAALYPATQPLYRGVGFEQAGTYTRYRLPIAALPVGPHDLEVVRVPPDAAAAAALLGDLYLRVARGQNGFLDRTAWFWRRAVDPLQGEASTFCVREGGEVTGYLVLGRTWLPRGRPGTDISCREMISATPAAAGRLWTLLADERSLARSLVITGPPTGADQILFTEQVADVEWQVRWMLRILDVEAALAGRGYPAGLERQLALDLDDDLVPRNRGRFAVEVAGGRARVKRDDDGPAGAVKLSIRALAALYSGHLTAEQLAAVGLASGSAEALAALTVVFAAPPPWLPEMF